MMITFGIFTLSLSLWAGSTPSTHLVNCCLCIVYALCVILFCLVFVRHMGVYILGLAGTSSQNASLSAYTAPLPSSMTACSQALRPVVRRCSQVRHT